MNTARAVDLLDEASAFLSTVTGNLADTGFSLDHDLIRTGLALVLSEAMERISTVSEMIAESQPECEPA